MLVVAGLTLKSLQPRVWDADSPYYLSDLQAVMISYADFHRMPAARKRAMEQGLHQYLRVPEKVQIYLDNGAFYFLEKDEERPQEEYEKFVEQAKPDWWPIPQDFIPIPTMALEQQRLYFDRTMNMNRAYQYDGYVPVIHISRLLGEYTDAIKANHHLMIKPKIALGGIVPNLLRAPKAMSHREIIDSLIHVRQAFADKSIHVFGIGGTATLHLAALLEINSVDSSGWRNRAARGLVQLPGSGDRMVANLGSWRGREPGTEEWNILAACSCPACKKFGLDGLKATKTEGFCNRATHNLWVLLKEAAEIEAHLSDGTYHTWYEQHLDNTTYLPLIREIIKHRMLAKP
jgi:7-cyano-7-deazaguanine tRNA-ribosyltransferase